MACAMRKSAGTRYVSILQSQVEIIYLLLEWLGNKTTPLMTNPLIRTS